MKNLLDFMTKSKISFHIYYPSLPKSFQQLVERNLCSYIQIGMATIGYHRCAVMVNF